MTRVFPLLLASLLGLSACAPDPAINTASRAFASVGTLEATGMSQPVGVAQPRAPQTSNRDLARDFMDLSFQLESGHRLPHFSRFEGPITVRVTGAPTATLRTDLKQLVARLTREAGIPISQTNSGRANITIEAIPRAAIRKTLPMAACFVVPNVSSLGEYRTLRRSAQISWSQVTTRKKLAIFVPSDASPQEIRDCLHEELAQALGPLNDLYRLPDSVFNDDNVHTVLTGYDMLILRAYYHPSLSSGMSRDTVAARLPAILARINPDGTGRPATRLGATPRDWVTAVQTALGPEASPATRQQAAGTAVAIARTLDWSDHRRGFSHYALGRVLQPTDSARAEREFLMAAHYFGAGSETALHRAYTAAQLGAHALRRGNAPAVLQLVEPHLDIAARHENAALLATLKLLQAQALEQTGLRAESRQALLDSQHWALYGFGSESAVRAKTREIAALGPT